MINNIYKKINFTSLYKSSQQIPPLFRLKFNRQFLIHRYPYIRPTCKYFHINNNMEQNQSQTQNVNEDQFTFVKDESDPLSNKYGILEFIQSQSNPEERYNIKWSRVKELNEELDGTTIKMRVRLQRNRIKGKGGFLVLRDGVFTVQAVMFVAEGEISEQMIKFAEKIRYESLVDVEGIVKKVEKPIESCSQTQVEIQVKTLFLVSSAMSKLPFQMEDANRKGNPEDENDEILEHPNNPSTTQETKQETTETTSTTSETTTDSTNSKKADKKAAKEAKKAEKKAQQADTKKGIIVGVKTRLDNRVLDLRVPATQSLMKLQSGVSQLFREFMYKNQFTEIHSPKLISGASEGGSNVFKLKYFDQNACLAQSPQLYKQMAIIGDFDRVFEVAPVFRAENANTNRHLCEFNGLDMEMTIKIHFFEILDVIHDLFYYIYENLPVRYAHEMNIIANQYPFEPMKFSKTPVRLTFKEGCDLLKTAGVEQSVHEDLDTINEATLGRLVKEKFDTDFYVLYKYPKSARPFYTMPDPEDSNFTNSYDAFIRGEEVLSGAQRIHSYELLMTKVVEKGMSPETLKDYLNAFKLGAPAHGGAGIGLERVQKLFAGFRNIKRCCLFPRDPKRLTP